MKPHRVAALYDIHGNLPALEAVLEDVRHAAVDAVVVGGDVFPGPMAREALAGLLDLSWPVRFVQGNCERELLAVAAGAADDGIAEPYRAMLAWLAQRLDPHHRQLIAGWPKSISIRMEGLGEVLFCHATPRSDSEIFTRETAAERLLPIFASVGASLVVCGHTHMQFDRLIGRVRVVNAGSVGMPFGEPGAYWLLLGPDVELRRTDYDLERAAARIRATSYPQAEQFAAHYILQPPSERKTLEVFARTELQMKRG